MQTVISVIAFIVANIDVILMAVLSILMGVIAIAMLIPGEQPEKTLKAIVAFIEKFSKK